MEETPNPEQVVKKDSVIKDLLIKYFGVKGKSKLMTFIIVSIWLASMLFIGYSALYTIPRDKTEIICQNYLADNCDFVYYMNNYCFYNSTSVQPLSSSP